MGSTNELNGASKDLTTFITQFGRYRYERAPFGLSSIPEDFNRRTEEELRGFECTRMDDDVLIYASSPEDHLRKVDQFLQRRRERNIQLHGEKLVYNEPESRVWLSAKTATKSVQL